MYLTSPKSKTESEKYNQTLCTSETRSGTKNVRHVRFISGQPRLPDSALKLLKEPERKAIHSQLDLAIEGSLAHRSTTEPQPQSELTYARYLLVRKIISMIRIDAHLAGC